MTGNVPRADRRAVYERDGHRCVAAGPEGSPVQCVGGLTIQHRHNVGMGGSKIVLPRWELITMCWGHNNRAESDAAFAELCRKLGWKLEDGEDAAEVAVFYRWRLQWHLLGPGGKPGEVSVRVVADREGHARDSLAQWSRGEMQ